MTHTVESCTEQNPPPHSIRLLFLAPSPGNIEIQYSSKVNTTNNGLVPLSQVHVVDKLIKHRHQVYGYRVRITVSWLRKTQCNYMPVPQDTTTLGTVSSQSRGRYCARFFGRGFPNVPIPVHVSNTQSNTCTFSL